MTVQASGWQSVRKSSTVMGAGSGWNPNLGKVPISVSRYRIQVNSATDEGYPLPAIFLAEDNPGDVELLRYALKEHRVACELLVAEDGENEHNFIKQIIIGSLVYPSLVILDLNLPKRNGWEVLSRIRTRPALAEIPVVILSSSGSPRDLSDATRLGAREYIRKPSSLEGFLQIGRVLKGLIRPAE